ncbi:hypothetical protein BRARA_H02466 [Brassica rapa]|uniref:Uncharacterized protein n=1 Tax=Brassica campestris TaxID=3711 RepID=A0A397YM27_BRACM|nr:hypothetical protein BRARA_H02466 [Brassica rapa]
MGIIERIKEIEAEMARTQKNKATEYHLGQLKAKIAKLRTQLLEPPKGASGGGEGFEVTKYDEDVVQVVKKKERDEGGRGRFKSHSNAPARIADREKKAPLKQ